jgi:hypothetical protein
VKSLLRTRASKLGWNRHVFLRFPSEEFDELLSMPMGLPGIYLVGCAKEIGRIEEPVPGRGRMLVAEAVA